MKKKRKRWAGLFALALLCVAGLTVSMKVNAMSVTSSISMKISYGYQGVVKIGKSMPLTVTLQNEGTEFQGTVAVLDPKMDTGVVTSYGSFYLDSLLPSGEDISSSHRFEKQVTVAAKGQTSVSFDIPVLRERPQLKIQLLDFSGDVLAEEVLDISLYSYNAELYVGMATGEMSLLKVMKDTPLADYEELRVRVLPLDIREFPATLRGLEGLDMLIFERTQYQQLTESQKRNISGWALAGGSLVFTDEIDFEGYTDSRGNFDMQSFLEDVMGESYMEHAVETGYYGYSREYWDVSTLLEDRLTEEFPPVNLYILLLVTFTLLVGPGVYVLLKRVGKRRYMWGAVILVSIGCSLIIYLLGNKTRLRAPFINYVKVLTIGDESVYEKIHFNIRAPYNSPYELYLDNSYEITPLHESNYYYSTNSLADYEKQNISIYYGEEENTIRIQDIPSFVPEYFTLSRVSDIPDSEEYGVEVNARFFEGRMTGTVTSHLHRRLDQAMIMMYGHMIFLDGLEPGEEKSLDEFHVYSYTQSCWYQVLSDMLNIDLNVQETRSPEYVENYQQYQVLSNYVNQLFDAYTEDAYLLGISKETERAEFERDSAYEASGMQLVVVPVSVSKEKDGSYYEPQIEEYAEVLDGHYNSYSNSMYDELLVMEYSLGENLKEPELYIGQEDYYDKEMKLFSGSISFYNVNTGEYDEMDITKEKISAAELAPYLTGDQKLRIRYERTSGDMSEDVKLPNYEVVGRISDAEN